jgi:hypothetical protein
MWKTLLTETLLCLVWIRQTEVPVLLRSEDVSRGIWLPTCWDSVMIWRWQQ